MENKNISVNTKDINFIFFLLLNITSVKVSALLAPLQSLIEGLHEVLRARFSADAFPLVPDGVFLDGDLAQQAFGLREEPKITWIQMRTFCRMLHRVDPVAVGRQEVLSHLGCVGRGVVRMQVHHLSPVLWPLPSIDFLERLQSLEEVGVHCVPCRHVVLVELCLRR